MNKDATGGIAPLTRCQAKTISGRIGGTVEIRIRKNYQSVFPAEFERERFRIICRQFFGESRSDWN